MENFTHSELVKRAGIWLRGKKCMLIVLEPRCWSTNEIPDAIGWKVDGYSIMVECKTTRSDFYSDARKVSKQSGRETMGRERYYMAPKGIITHDMLSDGYGLLEPTSKRIKVVVQASRDERIGRAEAELPLLVNQARRRTWKSVPSLGRCVIQEIVPEDVPY